jgi:hypothetical protein
VLAEDVVKAGKIEFLIRNSNNETFIVPVEVVEPPAAKAG